MESTTKVQEASVDETVKGKTSFGLDQIDNPTPKWATKAFRWFFYITSVALFIISVDDNISAAVAKNIGKYISIALMAAHGLKTLTGVDVDENEFKKA
ncbi:hypothetical protein [Segetibacter aerophilus]|uniref:Uncharacterized protein n=1 Tax=Segetibacter aerophilus TaxID=670293 RepID=A0A512BA22_9BACT|nr:hypothetical protein [Segetibacter aerophilus]GEO08783.1 hypothetical protein SAE01_12790 [Segetibacter aerophilus]